MSNDNRNNDSVQEFIGPSRPPHLSQSERKQSIIGPMIPASFQTASSLQAPEDDDTFGPAPPPIIQSKLEEHLELERIKAEFERRARKNEAPVPKSTTSQRSEWMTAPPEPKRAQIGIQMKSRTFSKSGGQGPVDNSSWTALPGEKRPQTANDLLAEKRVKISPKEQQILEKVAEYRGTSLMDQHSADHMSGKTAIESLENSKFDRERDLVASRMPEAKKQELVRESKKLGSKFSHGNKVFL